MKLSTKSRYAIRSLVSIASSPHVVPISEISKEQEISERYLELIFARLKQANLLKSLRGSQGGYLLARTADRITLHDVMRATEKNLNIVKSTTRPDTLDRLLSEELWTPINQDLIRYLKSITIGSLATQEQKSKP